MPGCSSGWPYTAQWSSAPAGTYTLPARAYDNGIYAVFANAIGMDDDQLKNGCSMIIDPFGDVIAECRSLDNDVAVATCVHRKLTDAGGHRYRHILGAEHRSEQKVAWMPIKP